MQVTPYLSFEGRCEEALEFYRKALGATVEMMMRFEESPEREQQQATLPPGCERKILHAELVIGDTKLMASDGQCSGQASFGNPALALQVADDAEAARCFAALAEGGTVRMPLTKTFFASSFGMLADRFGVEWMVVSATTS